MTSLSSLTYLIYLKVDRELLATLARAPSYVVEHFRFWLTTWLSVMVFVINYSNH